MTATLERLPAIEVEATEARRRRFASPPAPATLQAFDDDAQPGVDRALINGLGVNSGWPLAVSGLREIRARNLHSRRPK